MRHGSQETGSMRLPIDWAAISDEAIARNDRLIAEFFQNEDIDSKFVTTLPVDERSGYLVNQLLGTTTDFTETHPLTPAQSPDDEVGLIVVKPEIFPGVDLVLDYLRAKGFDPYLMNKKFLGKQEWLEMYGYMVQSHPDIINLYIIQRSLGMRAILFKHLRPDQYVYAGDRVEEATPREGSLDIDRIFDAQFCGQVSEVSEGTLRGSVSLPIMKELGFGPIMAGYASSFDTYDFFRDTGGKNLFRAYNGVHVPSDKDEKIRNLRLFN